MIVLHKLLIVSDLNDNGLTPLQGQQDEQPEGVNIPGNAIDNDVVDIMTLYPLWSPNTNDRCDNNKVPSDRSEKKYKTNCTKAHQLKLKTISPI